MSRWEWFGRLVLTAGVVLVAANVLGAVAENPNGVSAIGQAWTAAIIGALAAMAVLLCLFLKDG